METLKVKIKALPDTAMLHHNIRLANPMDEGSLKMKSLTSVRKKTEEVYMGIADVEFEYGMYYDARIGPYIPGIWLDATLIEGGKLQKNGSKIKRSTLVVDTIIPLEYDGPRDMEALKADMRFRDIRAVTIGTSKNMRCRPRFTDWKAQFTIQYNPDLINKDELVVALKTAGACIGLGDYRPRFGRFEVESVR